MSHSGKRGESVINLAIMAILVIKLRLVGESYKTYEHTSICGEGGKQPTETTVVLPPF